MTEGGRIPQNATDWMRGMERRISALERRGGIASPRALLGNGIGPMATRTVDWNSNDTLLNGWYFSDALSINSPNPTYAWLGMVIASYPGHGLQVVWSHNLAAPSAVLNYVRQYHRHASENVAEFTAWSLA